MLTTITEITEPSALKKLLKDHDSTSTLSKYEIRTRGVQFLAPTLCGFLISFGLFSPYILILLISIISLFFLSKLDFTKEEYRVILIREIFQSIREAILWLKKNQTLEKLYSLHQ